MHAHPSPSWSASIRRLRNGVAKVAAGLTPFGESVWPGVRNDLFVAHESIYAYFATFAQGRRVLDAGCGAGYGALALARAGARSVLAVDIDRRNIAYGRRHFAHPSIRRPVMGSIRTCRSRRCSS